MYILNRNKQFEMSRIVTKPTKWHVSPAKTQISLGIRQVWTGFAVRVKKAWVLSYTLSAQRRLWSDWADAQADLSLRWAHNHFVGFVTMRLICLSPCDMQLRIHMFLKLNILLMKETRYSLWFLKSRTFIKYSKWRRPIHFSRLKYLYHS